MVYKGKLGWCCLEFEGERRIFRNFFIFYNLSVFKILVKGVKLIKNYQKWSKLIKNYQKLSKIIKDYQKLSKIIQNVQKLSKMFNNDSKMFKNVQKCSKIFQKCNLSVPDARFWPFKNYSSVFGSTQLCSQYTNKK